MKNVVILAGSPRIQGNSDVLCDEFMKGAIDAGHRVEKIQIAKEDIHFCTGCGSCPKTGRCVQRDAMDAILEKMVAADVIVMATPVYFYNMSAQMKMLIDRTCPVYTKLGNKDYYVIMSAAEEDGEPMKHVVESFQGFFDCLEEPNVRDIIYGLCAYDMHEVEKTPLMNQAYQAGNKI
ncbi:flavodoxin family protein [Amedibacillus sp. YH-ame10]